MLGAMLVYHCLLPLHWVKNKSHISLLKLGFQVPHLTAVMIERLIKATDCINDVLVSG